MEIAIFLLVIFSLLILLQYIRTYRDLGKERFRTRSISTKYGKLTEQFLPLVDSYPWDPSAFRFMGSPVDGVQFENDKVIFVEFKAANSKLSRNQRHIRDLINAGKVTFEVIRVG